ncbi:MAG: amino acid permease [Hyphomonadaceae bacterium]|nr:amino acid permease [Hyphomonadaceae bacterium]
MIAAQDATSASGPPAPALIGFWTCTALVIGNMIGMGIFMMPAVLAPFGFNALIGWGVTVAGSLALAAVYASLARDFPNPDGPYGYIRATQGEIAAFVAAWCYWLSCWITNATLAVAVTAYLQAVAPELFTGIPPALAALAFIWIFVGINLLGVPASGPVQIITTTLKLVPMIAIILLGVWLLFSEPGAYTRSSPTTPIALPQIMAASTIALFAMLGMESASIPAGRVKDAKRTIPIATLVGTLATALIYVAISVIPMLLIPQAELAASQAPFVDLLNRMLGDNVGRWIALFVVISGLGCLNGWTLLCSELTRTMARNAVLPSVLGRDNARGAASAALIVIGVLASGMVLMNYSRSLVQGFAFLSTVVTAANLPLYLLSSLALGLFVFRGVKASPKLLVIGVLGLAYSIFAFVGVGREPFLWALGLGAVGLPIYAAMRFTRARARAAATAP